MDPQPWLSHWGLLKEISTLSPAWFSLGLGRALTLAHPASWGGGETNPLLGPSPTLGSAARGQWQGDFPPIMACNPAPLGTHQSPTLCQPHLSGAGGREQEK